MPRARAATALVCLLIALSPSSSIPNEVKKAETAEQDQFEERLVNRWIEKGYRHAKTDRALWIKELERAFPNETIKATSEEDYMAWFVLLAGDAADWRRDDAPSTALAELFDRLTQRLDLGPVPSIRRQEFAKYVKNVLVPSNPPMPGGGQGADPAEDADKVFRVLDRDQDGVLRAPEYTARLRGDRLGLDPRLNASMTRQQYRDYFKGRVATGIETMMVRRAKEKAAEKVLAEKMMAAAKVRADKEGKNVKMTDRLPDWFSTLDLDMDGQIALSEWRKGGRLIAQFVEMDLDGDGLLTRPEYVKYVRTKEQSMADGEIPEPGRPAKK